jgi:hypothetical protein
MATTKPAHVIFPPVTFGGGFRREVLDHGRRRTSSVFQEARLNRLGYRVPRSGAAANSIPIFRRIVELFPASSNAYDSLAEAL